MVWQSDYSVSSLSKKESKERERAWQLYHINIKYDLKAKKSDRLTEKVWQGARSFSLQKRYLQNFFLQNISLQRLFLQEFFSTEVIPTQRLNLQHNIPTEFLSTLPSSYIPFFIQRLYLQENFSEKIYHKFLFQRTE